MAFVLGFGSPDPDLSAFSGMSFVSHWSDMFEVSIKKS